MEALQTREMGIPEAEMSSTLYANLNRDGAIAQGKGAAAVGKRGIFISGDEDSGFITTGDDNTLILYINGDPEDRRHSLKAAPRAFFL